jgi:hypothetical protein
MLALDKMQWVSTPLACRARVITKQEFLADITLHALSRQIRVLPFKRYGDYIWATVWPNENPRELGPELNVLFNEQDVEEVEHV